MVLREAVICEPLRTPVGKIGGALRDLSAAELAVAVVQELLHRTGLGSSDVDDVVFGQCYANGEAPAIGRVVALDSGLSVEVPGWQVDRRCGSGLQAVIEAAMQVQTGVADLIIAGGAESMSQVEFYSTALRWGTPGGSITLQDRLIRARMTAGGRFYAVPGGMIETAENLRREYGISRQEQDEFSLRSHQRAIEAHQEGRFADELVPVRVVTRRGETTIDRDEHPRQDASMEALAALRPVLAHVDSESTVTAGNSSGQNDGAAACIVTHPAYAAERRLRPLARLVSWGTAGVEPSRMGIGPVPATERALRRAGLHLFDMDLIELNEAFASQVLACLREWHLTDSDLERLNVNGSGISLGHPVGATGCRILSTMLRELDRREGRYGLETMCIGGGQGLAAVFERTP